MFTKTSETVAKLMLQRAKTCTRKPDINRCLTRAMEALRAGYSKG